MEDRQFILPIGLKVEGEDIVTLPIAETGGEAERIYTKRPSTTKLHTWFGQLIAASVERIGNEKIAEKYLKQEDKKDIPALVKKIPFLDAGTLLIQIQRECWERHIENQKLTCTNCGSNLQATIDLDKVEIPENKEGKAIETFDVELPKTYTISTGIEQLKEYDGYKFNHIKFRTATLGDAIKHEGVTKDEVTLWRSIGFDTMIGLFYKDEDGNIEEVPDGYVTKRGKQLFTKDFNTPTLKAVRSGLQKSLPSAKFFYEEECPECGKDTPFFASVSNFFSA